MDDLLESDISPVYHSSGTLAVFLADQNGIKMPDILESDTSSSSAEILDSAYGSGIELTSTCNDNYKKVEDAQITENLQQLILPKNEVGEEGKSGTKENQNEIRSGDKEEVDNTNATNQIQMHGQDDEQEKGILSFKVEVKKQEEKETNNNKSESFDGCKGQEEDGPVEIQELQQESGIEVKNEEHIEKNENSVDTTEAIQGGSQREGENQQIRMDSDQIEDLEQQLKSCNLQEKQGVDGSELRINSEDLPEACSNVGSCFKTHPLLQDYTECFFNWILPEKAFTVEEAITISSVIADKMENITGPLLQTQLKYCPVETISYRLNTAFCHLALSKFTEADIELEDAAKLIKQAAENKFIPVVYTEGLVYLFTGLEAFKKSLALDLQEDKSKAEDDLKKYLENSTPYSSLPELARAAVVGVHSYFAGNRRCNAESLSLAKEVVEKDPDNVEWLVNLHSVTRIHRKENNHREGPSEDEKLILIRGIEVDKNHVMVKLAVCSYLADLLRTKTWDPKIGPLVLEGYQEFQSIKEVVDFMKAKAQEILKVMEHNVKINISIAEFFSASLPFEHRDSLLAKKCLSNALLMNTKSSKANHKMGLFLLTVEKKLEEAKQYIKEATVCDPRNFSAVIDLIQILLSKPLENSAELTAIFKEHVIKNQSQWPSNKLASLQITKGFFHYMKREKENALLAWIAAYKTDPESIRSFKQIPFYCTRYNWNRKDISISNIHDFLKQTHSEKGDSLNTKPKQNVLRIIALLLQAIESAKSEEDIRNANRSQRGGGRGGAMGSRDWARTRGGGFARGGRHEGGERQPQPSTSRGTGTGIFRGRGSWGGGRGKSVQFQNSESQQSSNASSEVHSGPNLHAQHKPQTVKKHPEKLHNKVRDPIDPKPDSGRGFSHQRGRGRGGGRGRGSGQGRGGGNADSATITSANKKYPKTPKPK